MSKDDVKFQEDYKYGFKDKDVSILKTDIGVNEDIVRQISKLKNEPEWMLEYRLKSYKAFRKLPLPNFGTSHKGFDLRSMKIASASCRYGLICLTTNFFLLPNKTF